MTARSRRAPSLGKCCPVLESVRIHTNAKRLAELNPVFRAKVEAVLADLESHGLRPLVATGYRSTAEQARKKAGGFSKVSFGLHNCRNAAGQPDSLAADIVDADLGWNARRSFWLMLISAGVAHGLECGGFWGLKSIDRANIRAAIMSRRWDKVLRMGWDVAHVQIAGISPIAARFGKRPKA